MSNEARVGIFVVFILIIFFVLSVKIGELNLTKKGTYPITMAFSTVEGLKISSILELAGVQVGKVTGISLNKDYSAVVSVELDEDIKLPIDSTASIGTKGVLGDKIIILSPGVSKILLILEEIWPGQRFHRRMDTSAHTGRRAGPQPH